MTEIRISFVVLEDDRPQSLDYTPMWKNFSASIWNDAAVGSPRIRQILQTDYNARIEQNDIVFATSEDAVRFILRWS